MQGKGKSLRLSLMALVVVLIFGALGGMTLARDAFDADYNDCPAVTRLDAVDGLTIDRTDEEDEIRISWDALGSADLSQLGPNGYRARLTIIVEDEDPRNVALGDTNLVVDDIDFTKALTVSVAVTLSDYVISDIAEADFTSGMPAPRFSTAVRVSDNVIFATVPGMLITSSESEFANLSIPDGSDVVEKAADEAEIVLLRKTADNTAVAGELATYNASNKNNAARDAFITALISVDNQVGDVPSPDVRDAERARVANLVVDDDDGPAEVGSDLINLGSFYYLGFNNLFDNWYHTGGGAAVTTKPNSPRFRVGLQHGSGKLDPGEADFANYRIVIEDSSGDLLGYQAETVDGSRTYGGNKIVFETGVETPPLLLMGTGDNLVPSGVKDFTNVRLSNQVSSSQVSPYYGRGWVGTLFTRRADLSHANVGVVNALTNTFPISTALYADAPVEYFDFPNNVFDSDGSYTIKAWAEDDDGTRISPQASIVISAQEGQPVPNPRYEGYGTATPEAPLAGLLRTWAEAADGDTGALTVYGFSIQDE